MRNPYLLVSIGSRICAFPLSNVSETMRPLKTTGLPSAPAFIPGIATVRGALTVVVDGRALFEEPAGEAGRMVILKQGIRTFGLTVDSVVGIEELDESGSEEWSALLPSLTTAYVQRLLQIGSTFAAVLESGRIVPESVWHALQEFERHA